ncbi:MAG TPA: GTPase Era [Lachnospiraceae bacterium]|nr:GTPase Era [Lachnospiraceae bacterium]
MKKSGFVAIVGRPNVGKSTLMNRIIGQKIAITSKKPQTTRNQIRTVYTSDEGQIVFVDTPGVIKSKNKLGDYMVGATSSAVKDVDLILWLVEPSDYIGEGDKAIAEKLKNSKVPVVLVINKLDTIKKSDVIIFMDAYRKIMDFAEIVPISAFKGENVDELIKVIFSYLKEGPYFFDEDTVTDQPSRQIAAELIREKALRLLDKEIPHGIAVVIDVMQYRKTSSGQGIYDIDATIICERDSHKGIIIGKGGQMLKKIGQDARIDIEKMMETKVNLHLFVKVKNNWRDSDYLVKNFGYKNDDK